MNNIIPRVLFSPNLLFWSQIFFLTFMLVFVLDVMWGTSIIMILSFVAELLTKFFVTHLIEKTIGHAI
jgi:hypothetical protein